MSTCTGKSHNNFPAFGLLALAVTIGAYALSQSGVVSVSAATLGVLFPICGCLQIMCGLRASQTGNQSAAAVLLPLGMFTLSLTGFEVFPRLGFGRAPGALTLGAYLSMWGLFAAIQFLGSFKQGRLMQLVFANLMFCLLLLAMGNLRENPALLLAGGAAGLLCGLTAGYVGLVQLFKRSVLQTGRLGQDINDQLTP